MEISTCLVIIIVTVCITVTVLEYGMPLHDIDYIEGKIDSVSIGYGSSTLYNFENKSFEVKFLPEEVELHTLCRVHYGTSFLFQDVKFISIEYL